jgi:DNA-nicking Smr family endonuclease
MRRLNPEDAELWRRVAREIAPLPGRALPEDRGRPARNAPEPQLAPDRRHPPGTNLAGETPALPRKPPPPLDQFAGVDRATAERLRRGRRAIEARLDLHGMTQPEAHRALQGFVSGSRAAGRRCVLVITGHGRSSGGILKSAVPRWLHEPDLRRDVLAIAPARPQHGGAGALYLLLRRSLD